MKTNIAIYSAEKEAGLSDLIQQSNSIAYLTLPSRLSPDQKQLKIESAIAERDDIDLYPLKTILASVGWNGNDDVFLPEETWAARHTPEDKPFNYNHDFKDIIGHMTAAYVVDDEGNVLDDALASDALPDKFHVVSEGVIYKHLTRGELEERASQLITEIEKGEWYVSMECLFAGFDYVLRDSTGACSIVQRNKDTAFLTKHLRAYKGTGQYQGCAIGRAVRNIVFCGKGLVKKPANPDSIILLEDFSVSNAKIFSDVGYLHSNDSKPEKVNVNELEQAQAKIKQLEAELAASKTKELDSAKAAAEKVAAEAKTALEAAQAETRTANEAKVAAEKTVAERDATVAKLQEELVAAQAESKARGDELDAIKAAAKTAERTSKLKTLGLSDEQVKTMADAMASLSDEAFESQLKVLTDVAAKATPKNTAAAAKLDDAKPDETEPAGTVSTKSGDRLKQLSAAVASYFEVTEEEDEE